MEVNVSNVVTAVAVSLMAAAPMATLYFAILETHWAQRRRTRKLPYGDQRVEILERRWGLERLAKRIADPDHKIETAIKQCWQALADIDRAVVLMHQAEIDAVGEQRQIATAVLEVTRKTLQDSTLLRSVTLEAVPVQKSSVPAARTHA